MKILVVVFLSLVIVSLFGCTTAQKGAVAGGAVGAGVGAIIGHQSGHGAEGAGIGAAVGALGGALVGEQMDTKFCPTCGKHYTSGVEYCPVDGTKLELIKK